MIYKELTIITDRENSENICNNLYTLDISGLYIEDYGDLLENTDQIKWGLIDEVLLCKDKDAVIIRLYLTDNEIVDQIMKMSTELNFKAFVNEVSDENWADGWKKYYKPFRVSKNLIIKPSWEDYKKENNDDIIIELDPGMAFGTGTHETTKMCVNMIEKYLKNDTKILDVGTGSGILAICSVLLGAKSAFCVDIDENAVKIANENAKINSVSDKLEIVCGDLLDKVNGKYDIVVANIIANAIINVTQQIMPFICENGYFITSGIIKDRALECEDAFLKNGFKIIEKQEMGEWVCYCLQ